MRGVTTLKAVCICADCVAIGSQRGRVAEDIREESNSVFVPLYVRVRAAQWGHRGYFQLKHKNESPERNASASALWLSEHV